MTFVFRNETHDVKLKGVSIGIGLVNACSTWMCCERGEGEEEIENHGRSRVKVSSQGTDLNGQWSLRMRAHKANLKKSTGCTIRLLLNSPFSLLRCGFNKSRSPSLPAARRSAATPSPCRLGSLRFLEALVRGNPSSSLAACGARIASGVL